MSRHTVRYEFEHNLLPRLFFSDKRDFVLALLRDDTVLYRIIDDIFQEDDTENPYEESDFRVLADHPSDGIFALQIVYPEPEDEPLCYNAFLIFDKEFEKLGYYCVEKGGKKSDAKPFLCAWGEDEIHYNFGSCTFDNAENYERCLAHYDGKGAQKMLNGREHTSLPDKAQSEEIALMLATEEEIEQMIDQVLSENETEKPYSEEIAQIIEDYLKSREWDYNFDDEEGVFLLDFAGSGKIGVIRMFIRVREDHFYIRVYAKNVVADADDKDMMAKIAEFVARANFYCKISRLILDYDFEAGRIESRAYCFCKDALPSESNVHYVINTALNDFEGYAPGLMKIIYGDADVKTVFDECESSFADAAEDEEDDDENITE